MTAPFRPPLVVVVGGGLSGLWAARRVLQAGGRAVVLEASDEVGGQIRSRRVAHTEIDVGAEAMHLGIPGVAAAIEELGLTESLVTARTTASWLATQTGLRVLPAGVGPAGPTRIRPVLRSRVMTPAGLARAGAEPLAARRMGPVDLSAGHDVSVADFVTARFGAEVTDRFVDPLLGSLHSGDVRRLSLRACAPALVGPATRGQSLLGERPMAAARRRVSRLNRRGSQPGPASRAPVVRTPGPPAPGAPPAAPTSFVSWHGGLSTIVDRIRTAPDAPVDVRLGCRVTRLERDLGSGAARYRVVLDTGEVVEADGVILALPASAAAGLLQPLAPEAATVFGGIETATVATVILGYPRDQVAGAAPLAGTGVLVPSTEHSLLKASTFLTTKWSAMGVGSDPGVYWLRMSAGRAGSEAVAGMDDDELVGLLRRELRRFTQIEATPRHVHIERWPAAMPQLTVGHPDRVAHARRILAGMPGVAVAGASYDGIGLGSCLASAAAAARLVTETLADTRVPPPSAVSDSTEDR